MTGTYLVHLPKAEACHLAGIGPAWPATPEARALDALREWLHGVSRCGTASIAVSKIMADLTLILDTVPAAPRPVRGPLGPSQYGPPPPGHVEYLGSGTVRLDEAAISTLSELREDEDFRITFTDAGPMLAVGAERYVIYEEEPDAKL